MNAQRSNRHGGTWLALDKLGAAGAILSAVAAPCCFPLFATIGGALGLGSVSLLRGNAPVLIQAMTALAFAGQIIAYRRHRRRGPPLVSGASAALVVAAYAVLYDALFIYSALAGLTVAATWNWAVSRRAPACCGVAENRPPTGR